MVLVRPGERSVADSSAVSQRVPSGERLVLVVDQLEEMFTSSVVEDERQAFMDALVDAAWDPERRALILVALRADFLGNSRPTSSSRIFSAPNHVLLGPMSAAELRRAIERPAKRVGLEVEPTLVDALVDDVAARPAGCRSSRRRCSTSGANATVVR